LRIFILFSVKSSIREIVLYRGFPCGENRCNPCIPFLLIEGVRAAIYNGPNPVPTTKEEKMGKSRFGKVMALVLVVSVGVVFSSGCFGKFQLTRNLYEINKSVEDKYLRSAVTWLFVIPYGIAGFLDFAVFNLIEFWSGENPLAAGAQARVFEKGDDRAVMTFSREGGATVATIKRYREGSLVSTLRVRDGGTGSVTSELREDGRVVRTMTATPLPDGSVSVVTVSASGTESVQFSPTAVETHRARVPRLASKGKEAPSAAGAAPLAISARVPARQG
jgi:hypothetical protein